MTAAALAAAAENLDVAFADHRILLDGRDVTDRIRGEDISAAASQVAVHPRRAHGPLGASGRSTAPRASSPTARTWGRSSSRTPSSRCF